MRVIFRRTGASLIALSFLAGASANAQMIDEPEGEIVVTARKGSERLMDVPAAISVLNQKSLESNQISSLSDLNRVVPSLTIFPGVAEYLPAITMRGIATTQGSEPSVSLIIDGVQSAGGTFFNQSLDDAASIEVLRGPQGALYGRGAIAGAILINTKRPTNDFHADARLLAGNGGTQKASVTVSGPIVKDTLLLKVSGSYDNYDGLIRNAGYNGFSDSKRTYSTRGELVFSPTTSTSITLLADYLDYKGVGVDWAVVSRDQLNDYDVGPNYNAKPFEDRWARNFAVKIEQDVGFGKITSVTQNSRQEHHSGGDGEFSPQPLFLFEQTVATRAWNQDLRYTSPEGDRLNFMVGLFYQDRKQSQPLIVTGDPGGPYAGFVALNASQYDTSKAYAAYTQGKYAFGHGWDLTVALRYDIEDREQFDRNDQAASQIKERFEAFQPQASLAKEFSSELTAYASYGRGFRSGGFNAFSDVLIPRPTAAYPVRRIYPKELADNFEVGFKAQLFDKTLYLTGAAYYTKFKNQQYFLFFPPSLEAGTARDIVSIPKTDIKGVELEASWNPLAGLRLNGSAVFTDGTIKGGIYDGNSVANTLKNSFSAGGEYEFGIGPDASLTVRADYQRQGRVFYDIQNSYRYNGVDLLSGRVSVRTGPYELAVLGQNLLDKKYPAAFSENGFADGVSLRRRIRPRTYGIECRLKF